MKRAKLYAIFLVLMLAAGFLQFKYDSHVNYFGEKKVFVTLPPGNTLRVLSFGYHDLVADMLFIWSIQFYSTPTITNRHAYLERVYNTITDLAPYYMEPYIVGSWIMGLEAGKIEMAIRLLEKGARNMPDEWIFEYECADFAKRMLKDYKRAEKYYQRAAQRPNAPPMIKRRQAHLVYLQDDLTRAWAMWKEIYDNPDSRMARDAAYHHLYQIKFEMDKKVLEAKLQIYKQRYRRFPMDLSQLVRAGLIKEIPRDFKGNIYTYDPEEGKIIPERVFKWK
jgi:tetratricopeptide (TPR) repeat protein